MSTTPSNQRTPNVEAAVEALQIITGHINETTTDAKTKRKARVLRRSVRRLLTGSAVDEKALRTINGAMLFAQAKVNTIPDAHLKRDLEAQYSRVHRAVRSSLEKLNLHLQTSGTTGKRTGRMEPQQQLMPAQIGQYRILDKIGEGGMGEVYLAYDEKLERKVAIKRHLIVNGENSEKEKKRIEEEARIAGRINSPYTVGIFGCDESDGSVFIVMEYMEGGSLVDFMKMDWANGLGETPTLSPKAALFMLLQMAKGMEAAHKQKVFHRDIKPANFLISNEIIDALEKKRQHKGHELNNTDIEEEFEAMQEIPWIKIGDFGISREGTAINTETLRSMTIQGETTGTIAFMAPECYGEVIDDEEKTRVSASGDVFALGLSLYTLITGTTPETAWFYSINMDTKDLVNWLTNVLKALYKSPVPSIINPQEDWGFNHLKEGGVFKDPIDAEVITFLSSLCAVKKENRTKNTDVVSGVKNLIELYKPHKRRDFLHQKEAAAQEAKKREKVDRDEEKEELELETIDSRINKKKILVAALISAVLLGGSALAVWKALGQNTPEQRKEAPAEDQANPAQMNEGN